MNFVDGNRLYPVRFRHFLACPGQDARFCQPASPDAVHEIHDGIVLLDSLAAEVLPHRVCQLALGLAPEGLLSCQCRGVEADAARFRQDPGAVVACVGGRGREVVLAAVPMEKVTVEGGPLDL